MSSITNLKTVMAQLKDQHSSEVIMAPHMTDKVSLTLEDDTSAQHIVHMQFRTSLL